MDYELAEDDPPPPPPPSPLRWVAAALAAALLVSLVGNAVQWRAARPDGGRAPANTVVVSPRESECPTCAVCADAGPCPTCPACPTITEVHRDGGARTPTPRVDQALARQGEAQLGAAENDGERDPVNLRAQRTMVTGVDQIVTSRSPAAAERFLQRNLPSLASMDCSFRDPAAAEHVRMRLRELNALARPRNRLSEADLARYERDLRCPRE